MSGLTDAGRRLVAVQQQRAHWPRPVIAPRGAVVPRRLAAAGVLLACTLLVAGCAASPSSVPVPRPRIIGSSVPPTLARVTSGPSTVPTQTPSPGLASGPMLGRDWTRIAQPGFDLAFIQAVAAGGPGLVAVGNAGIWTSPDGLAWTQAVIHQVGIGDPRYFDVVGAQGQTVVAINRSRRVYVSHDGVSWSLASTLPLGFNINAVFALEQGWFGAGSYCSPTTRPGSGCPAAIYTSSDGGTWTRVTAVPAADDALISKVMQIGPQLVATGSTCPGSRAVGTPPCPVRPLVWTSSDGRTWSDAPGLLPSAEALAGRIAHGSRLWVSFGEVAPVPSSGPLSAAWTSTDGLAWQRVPDQPAFADVAGLKPVAIGSRFVAGGDVGNTLDHAAVLTSPDGVHWARVPDNPLFIGDTVREVFVVAGRVVAIGSTGIWVSPPLAGSSGP